MQTYEYLCNHCHHFVKTEGPWPYRKEGKQRRTLDTPPGTAPGTDRRLDGPRLLSHLRQEQALSDRRVQKPPFLPRRDLVERWAPENKDALLPMQKPGLPGASSSIGQMPSVQEGDVRTARALSGGPGWSFTCPATPFSSQDQTGWKIDSSAKARGRDRFSGT